MFDVGKIKAGETLVVSGAAGATGSVVCQLGKRAGAKVIAIAGSKDKCDWLEKDLGVDKAINFVFSFVRIMRHTGKVAMLMHSSERHELLRERSHFRTAESSRAAADHERSTGGLGSSPVRRCLRPSLECDYRVVLPGHDQCPWCAASLPFARGKPIAVHFTRRRVELTRWQQHTFAVVRSAGSSEYNYDNPIWRDVVSTGTPTAGDNVTIRFRVSDIITLRDEYIS